MADARPSVYLEGDAIIYRASSVGLCERSLVAARLGFERADPPPPVRDAACAGTRLEPLALARLRELGWDISHEQALVELAVAPNLVVRGHIEALAEDFAGQLWLIEVKGMSSRDLSRWRCLTWKACPSYAWQVSTYALALGLDRILFAPCDRSRVLDPGCKWTADDWCLTQIVGLQHSVEDLREKLLRVEAQAATGELPPCDERHSYYDPFAYVHPARARAVSA